MNNFNCVFYSDCYKNLGVTNCFGCSSKNDCNCCSNSGSLSCLNCDINTSRVDINKPTK